MPGSVLLICLGVLLLYTLVLLVFGIGFLRGGRSARPAGGEQPSFSILICARNEEKTMAACLYSILQQDYPPSKVQIIVVNDASEDRSATLAETVLKASGVSHLIISNPEQKGKKASLSYAMSFAKHPWIVSRDADTISPSRQWLTSIAEGIQQSDADMLIGPIALSGNSGMLWALQAIENSILQVLAGGSAYFKRPFLCSGANLVFKASMYTKVNGYQSHAHLASGDDVLFMEDVKKANGNIHYLHSKPAIVETLACRSLSELLNQKIRWSGKFKHNPNLLNSAIAVLVTLANVAWLYCFVDGYVHPVDNSWTLVYVVGKLCVDFLMLLVASTFIRQPYLFWYSLPVGCIYPVYACVIAVGSLILKPSWKK